MTEAVFKPFISSQERILQIAVTSIRLYKQYLFRIFHFYTNTGWFILAVAIFGMGKCQSFGSTRTYTIM